MALRATRAADSITLDKLANIIAHEVVTLLVRASVVNRSVDLRIASDVRGGAQGGQPLRVGNRAYTLDDILLVRLHRVSRGSWQPEFWVRAPSAAGWQAPM